MDSLKRTLKHYIYQRSRVSRDELKAFARDLRHEESYMERQMRLIVKEGKIEPIRSIKGHINGYIVIRLKSPDKPPQGLGWRKKLEIEQFKAKIKRDKNNRIIACA